MNKRLMVGLMALGLVASPVAFAKHDRGHESEPGMSADSELPPGLQKKAARGGQLPPGWEKKLRKGAVLEMTVYQACRPATRAELARIPAGPGGTVVVSVEGKLVRLIEATHTIVDVFDSLQ